MSEPKARARAQRIRLFFQRKPNLRAARTNPQNPQFKLLTSYKSELQQSRKSNAPTGARLRQDLHPSTAADAQTRAEESNGESRSEGEGGGGT